MSYEKYSCREEEPFPDDKVSVGILLGEVAVYRADPVVAERAILIQNDPNLAAKKWAQRMVSEYYKFVSGVVDNFSACFVVHPGLHKYSSSATFHKLMHQHFIAQLGVKNDNFEAMAPDHVVKSDPNTFLKANAQRFENDGSDFSGQVHTVNYYGVRENSVQI